MPDKKLTDNEIKKALECCNEPVENNACQRCPLHHSEGRCSKNMLDLALDLINRLQAENERLERLLEQEEKSTISLTKKIYKEAKAEAYKEFAELLHCQCENIINQPHNEKVCPISWKVAYEEFDENVDNLLKELVGDNG